MCNPHAVPIPVRLPPVGGDFFVFHSFSSTGDSINPQCHPLLLHSPPSLGGVLVFVVFNVVNVFSKLKIN